MCTPKYRNKVLFGQIRQHLGTVFHELARRKECQIEERHLTPDHVHIKFSARGYFLSRVGRDEEMIPAYIKNQASCPRVLHNRLWRFPFKPPALLGVIG